MRTGVHRASISFGRHHKHHDQRLDDGNDIHGDGSDPVDLAGTGLQSAPQDGREQNRQGVVAGQGCHGDAFKAIAAGKTVRKAVLHAHDLGGAAEACQCTADEQGDEHHALGVDTGGLGAGRVAAYEMETIAQPGAVEQEPDHGHQRHADENGGGEIMPFHELADTGLLRQGGGPGDALIIHKHIVDQIAAKQLGHIVLHQSDDDHIGAEPVAQKACDTGIASGAQAADHQNQRNEEHPGQGRQIAADESGHHGADIELTLRAQVHDLGVLGKGEGQAGKDQRRGIAQGGQNGLAGAKGTQEDELVDLHRVETGGKEDDAAQDQGQHKGQQGAQSYIYGFACAHKFHALCLLSRGLCGAGHQKSQPVVVKALRTVHSHNAALINNGDGVAEFFYLVQVGGNQQDSLPLVPVSEHDLMDVFRGRYVHAPGGLGADHHFRRLGEDPGNDHLLLVCRRRARRRALQRLGGLECGNPGPGFPRFFRINR